MEPTNRKILEQSNVKPKACFFNSEEEGQQKAEKEIECLWFFPKGDGVENCLAFIEK